VLRRPARPEEAVHKVGMGGGVLHRQGFPNQAIEEKRSRREVPVPCLVDHRCQNLPQTDVAKALQGGGVLGPRLGGGS
jgi:hypothetical protein